ncbi:hypothetical protein [Pelagibacterium sp.]|uniref:hypothetical protein n=1 Tax=Pelagibacterium sp. TaxID=1967288 RepID=UPI003BA96CE8
MSVSILTIVGLSHDVAQKKSYVNFVWADDPSKRLGLEVPYGLPLDQIEAEARKSVDALSGELSACRLEMP